jgi:hypothetical protein
VPTALLHHREIPWTDPFKNPEFAEVLKAIGEVKEEQFIGKRQREREQTPVSWVTIAGKATVHKSSCIRRKIALKMKTAASLVVTRGADGKTIVNDMGERREELVERVQDVGHHWFLKGSQYIPSQLT